MEKYAQEYMGRYLVLDFDDVIINNRTILNEEIGKIDHRATNEYDSIKHSDFIAKESALKQELSALAVKLNYCDAAIRKFIANYEKEIRFQTEIELAKNNKFLSLYEQIETINEQLNVINRCFDLNDERIRKLLRQDPVDVEKIKDYDDIRREITIKRDQLLELREAKSNEIKKIKKNNFDIIKALDYKDLYNKYMNSISEIKNAIKNYRKSRSKEDKKIIKVCKENKELILKEIYSSKMPSELKLLIRDYDKILLQTIEVDLKLDLLRIEHQKDKADFFDLKDQILEEVTDEYKGRIDYDRVLNEKDLFDTENRKYINSLIHSKEYKQVFIGSHCNTEREVETKRRIIEKNFPGVIFIPIPFHIEKYEKGKPRKRTNKAEYIMSYLKKHYADRFGDARIEDFVLIDDSESNIKDFEKAGGQGIVYDYKDEEDMLKWLEESKDTESESSRYHEFIMHKLHNLNPIEVNTLVRERFLHLPAPEEETETKKR